MKIFYNKFFIKIIFFLGLVLVNLIYINDRSQALNPEVRLTNQQDENRAMNLFLQVRTGHEFIARASHKFIFTSTCES